MLSDIWKRTIQTARKETRVRHTGYSFQLPASDILCALSYRQDSTYHDHCYTGRGATARTRNSSMGSPEGSIRRPIGATSRSCCVMNAMKSCWHLTAGVNFVLGYRYTFTIHSFIHGECKYVHSVQKTSFA